MKVNTKKKINISTGRKEMFYLMTHSTHFIYGYMALWHALRFQSILLPPDRPYVLPLTDHTPSPPTPYIHSLSHSCSLFHLCELTRTDETCWVTHTHCDFDIFSLAGHTPSHPLPPLHTLPISLLNNNDNDNNNNEILQILLLLLLQLQQY